ncbi:MAG: tRNA preQ1(34) S-adenosylmethionine ribosyltransferase-isomerase QueA [Deltaproteobacteria bacterium]|nr:tRNA preQ1(34) S-adenosylmethionine ribosyltransferase-isomerase QueA [Deltaproteobacteria bacterium]
MKVDELDYELPAGRIAERPLEDREGARLLVLARSGLEHARFSSFAERVPDGALVVVNDTRVLPARLLGQRRGTGGRVEILLLERRSPPGAVESWLGLGRSSRRLAPGSLIEVGSLEVEIQGVRSEGVLELGLRADGGVREAIEREGHVPLPPYLRRPDEPGDRDAYQTLYARHEGSVAAPTAGLHLGPRTLDRLRERGIAVAAVTLHVGLGTFRPVTADDLDAHPMHEEEFTVSAEAAEAVAAARRRGGKVVAIGTTTVRALESARDPEEPGLVRPRTGRTRLLIQPGYRFGPVDALLTNFHQPRSTLLALVAAFAGLERVRDAYASALREGYRFLSYGDAMFLPERAE